MKDDSVPGLRFPREHETTEQRAALRGGGNPRQLENLGAHYYISNTTIATMFASHGASGKRRWAALGDWASWMAVIRVQIAKQRGELWGGPSLMCT